MKTDLENKSGFLLPWLVFLTLILLISLILPIGFGEIFQEKNISLFNCPYKQIMGHDCPFCGMTRAFVGAAHINFKYSFNINPAGFFLFIYMVIYIGAGWIFIFSRNNFLKKFLEYNVLLPVFIVIAGSWIIVPIIVFFQG